MVQRVLLLTARFCVWWSCSTSGYSQRGVYYQECHCQKKDIFLNLYLFLCYIAKHIAKINHVIYIVWNWVMVYVKDFCFWGSFKTHQKVNIRIIFKKNFEGLVKGIQKDTAKYAKGKISACLMLVFKFPLFLLTVMVMNSPINISSATATLFFTLSGVLLCVFIVTAQQHYYKREHCLLIIQKLFKGWKFREWVHIICTITEANITW